MQRRRKRKSCGVRGRKRLTKPERERERKRKKGRRRESRGNAVLQHKKAALCRIHFKLQVGVDALLTR